MAAVDWLTAVGIASTINETVSPLTRAIKGLFRFKLSGKSRGGVESVRLENSNICWTVWEVNRGGAALLSGNELGGVRVSGPIQDCLHQLVRLFRQTEPALLPFFSPLWIFRFSFTRLTPKAMHKNFNEAPLALRYEQQRLRNCNESLGRIQRREIMLPQEIYKMYTFYRDRGPGQSLH